MTTRISATRFRLVCREVYSKVQARRSRDEPTREKMLLELLRRVESHLGHRPSAIPTDPDDRIRAITETLDGLVEGHGASAWQATADAELIAKILSPPAEKETAGTRRAGARTPGA